MKRKIAFLLTLVVLFSSWDVSAFAAEDDYSEAKIDISSEEIVEEDIVSEETGGDTSEDYIPEEDTEEEIVLEEELQEEPIDAEAEVVEASTPESSFEWNGDMITSFVGSETAVVIPTRATAICSCAFYNKSITSVDMSQSSVTTIGTSAFKGCTSLETVIIPESVTEIGYDAFSGCSKLNNVTIPKNVTTIGGDAFGGCTSLSNLTINATEMTHCNSAFGGCTSLEQVTLNPDMKYIPSNMFLGASITSIEIPGKVSQISSSAFKGCTSLETVTIPESVTEIEFEAFSGCSKLNNVTIPKNVTTIGGDAFGGCTSLSNLTINATEMTHCNSAFEGCTSLEQVTLNPDMKYIPSNMFWGASITSIEIPGKVSQISSSAFKECTSLETVIIPESVTEIGYDAFSGCSKLNNVVLPKSVETVKADSFTNCAQLTSITFGPNVSWASYIVDDNSSTRFKVLKNSKTDETLREAGYASRIDYVYGITYVLNGGQNTGSNPVAYSSGDELTLSDPTRVGYTFDGWYTDSKLSVPAGTTYDTTGKNVDLKFYAKWTPNKYKVTLSASGADLECSDITVLYDATYASALKYGTMTTVGLPTPVKNKYKFVGWYTQENGQGTKIVAGTKVTITENTTLYAYFTPYSYIINYNANGGKGTSYKTTYTADQTGDLAPCSYTKVGYEFGYWSLSKTGLDNSGNKSVISSLSDVTVKSNNQSITVYAIWVGETYSVNLNLGNGDNTVYKINCNYKSTFGDVVSGNKGGVETEESGLPHPTYATKKFMGWYTAAQTNGVVEATEITNSTVVDETFKNSTLYAWWADDTTKPEMPLVYVSKADGTIVPAETMTVSGDCKILVSKAGKDDAIMYKIDESDFEKYSESIDLLERPIDMDYAVTIKAVRDGIESDPVSFTISIERYAVWGDITATEKSSIFSNNAAQIPSGFWMSFDEKSFDDVSVVETGAAIKFNQRMRVYYGNTLLTENSDYSVSYKNNKAVARADALNFRGNSIAPTVIVKFKKNYSGTISQTFSITKANPGLTKASTSNVVIENIEPQTYTGRAIKVLPVIKVKSTGTLLVKDIDYTLTYSNNVQYGNKATVYVTFKGDKYYGELTKTFKINQVDMSQVSVEGNASVVYSPAGYQTISVVKYDNKTSDTSDDLTLKEGIDYTAKASYDKKSGKYIVTVTGKGNYKGTNKTYSYTLNAANIATYESNFKYQAPIVSTKAGQYKLAGYSFTVGKTTLGTKDYSIDYTDADGNKLDNKKVYSLTDEIKVKITGKGNYTGSFTKTFSPVENYKLGADAAETAILEANDVAWQDKAGVCKPKITVTNTKTGKKLSANKDYTVVDYKYTQSTSVKIYNKTTKRYDYKLVSANDVVDLKTDIIPAGTVIKVTIKGNGAYKSDTNNTLSDTFKIGKDISKASVKVTKNAQYKPGTISYLNASDLNIVFNKQKLGTNDFAIAGYKNASAKGNGKVTISGCGEYIGSKTISYKIVEAK